MSVTRDAADRRVNRATARLLGTVAFLLIAAFTLVAGSWSETMQDNLAGFAQFLGAVFGSLGEVPLLNSLADGSGLKERATQHPNEFGAFAVVALAYLASALQSWVVVRLLDTWRIETPRRDTAIYTAVTAASIVAPLLTVWWLAFR